MSVRLNRVTRVLKVGTSTIVEFLQRKGISIKEDANAKISEEQYEMLLKEFGKNLDIEKELSMLRNVETPQTKPQEQTELHKSAEKTPEKEVVQAESIGIEIPEDMLPKFKTVKKIDLDHLNPIKEKEEEPVEKEQEKQPEPPVVEAKEEETKVQLAETSSETVKTVEKTETQEVVGVIEEEEKTPTHKTEIFSLKSTIENKINVVGKIDLDAINQQTRPKKKTKEEKRKERESKDKDRSMPKQQPKKNFSGNNKDEKKPAFGTANNTSEAAGDDSDERKKKRKRIRKERVDIDKSYDVSSPSNNNNSFNNRSNNNDRHNRPRPKKIVKTEVNEEDVQKQIKDTLARLTNKGKTKSVRHRREKRDANSQRLAEMEEQEMQESQILKITEFVTANDLANMMNISVVQVISTCMSLGIMVSINQRLDAETINIVAEEFGFQTEYVSAEVVEAIHEEEDKEEDLISRPPIVTVMGHVDHGKTSLLDYIRKANVIAGEAGGITQHIGAYNVKLEDGRHITFLDTPGHEAFTAMRARGAKVTDIAIIIVAADDDVMPQTKEAINHASAAGVPIVFAINKIDKPAANPDKIKEELANMNYLVEEWGGKYQSQDISAKKGLGVAELLEKVLLEAELLDLKANPNKRATGSIIESTLDKGRGYVATVLVSNGTLKMGDIVLAGTNYGKVKAMFNERNQRIKEARPSEPVLILGLNGAPTAGDTFHVIETEQEAREIANKREQLQREQGLRTQKMLTLDEVGRRIALGSFQELNIIVKGDVDGSIEALSDSLIKLSTPEIQINVIHKAVGQISESDVSLAAASQAIIIGFQVRPSAAARKQAEQEGVDIRMYSVIYDAIEEVKSAMEGMLAPELKEEITSTIEVREVFRISKVGLVAGAMVKEGKVKRTNKARLIRDGIVIFSGEINALKRFKDDVKEVSVNYECGISLTNCMDIKVGDIIETFEEIEVKKSL